MNFVCFDAMEEYKYKNLSKIQINNLNYSTINYYINEDRKELYSIENPVWA